MLLFYRATPGRRSYSGNAAVCSKRGISRRATRGTRPAISHRGRVLFVERAPGGVPHAARRPGLGGRCVVRPHHQRYKKMDSGDFFYRSTPCGRDTATPPKKHGTRPRVHARRVAEVGARVHVPEKKAARAPKRVLLKRCGAAAGVTNRRSSAAGEINRDYSCPTCRARKPSRHTPHHCWCCGWPGRLGRRTCTRPCRPTRRRCHDGA